MLEHSLHDARRYGPRRGSALRAVRLAVALLLSGGCSSGPETPGNELQPGQTITVSALNGQATGRVSVDGASLSEGANAFLVAFEPPGTELTGASALMPAHGHGSPTSAVITKTAAGYRVSNLTFSMPGLWDVLLDVSVAGQQDRVEFSVDIP